MTILSTRSKPNSLENELLQRIVQLPHSNSILFSMEYCLLLFFFLLCINLTLFSILWFMCNIDMNCKFDIKIVCVFFKTNISLYGQCGLLS